MPARQPTLLAFYAQKLGYNVGYYNPEDLSAEHLECQMWLNHDLVYFDSSAYSEDSLHFFEKHGVPTSPDVHSLKAIRSKNRLAIVCQQANIPFYFSSATEKHHLSLLLNRNQQGRVTCYLPSLLVYDNSHVFSDYRLKPENIDETELHEAFMLGVRFLEVLDFLGTTVVHFYLNPEKCLAISGVSFSIKNTLLEELNPFGQSIRKTLLLSNNKPEPAHPCELQILEPIAARKFAIEEAVRILLNPYASVVSSFRGTKRRIFEPSKLAIVDQILIALSLHHIMLDNDLPVWNNRLPQRVADGNVYI